MKLYLTIAVLMLAFAALTEAQEEEPQNAEEDPQAEEEEPQTAEEEEPQTTEEEEPQTEEEELQTTEDKMKQFGVKLTEMAQGIATKAKEAMDTVQTSDVAVNTRIWIQERVDAMKRKLEEMTAKTVPVTPAPAS